LRRIDSDRSGKDMALLPTFSPDGSRLTYRLMQDKDQEPGMTVLIYDLATGKEKSFYSEAGQKMLPEFATAESATSTASATPASSAAPAK
jgi:Tol biopolymer transport system component